MVMASNSNYRFPTFFFFPLLLLLLLDPTSGEQPPVLKYHNGNLLKGNLTVNLIWYGSFTPAQQSIIVDFVNSFSFPGAPPPSAASWWKTTDNYKGGPSSLALGNQTFDDKCSLGKSFSVAQLLTLTTKYNAPNSINVILTAKDVAVDGFCMSKCATHGSLQPITAYIWVGNPETQCPGQCAWPFHQPTSGPQTPPLVPPNGDVGVDGMIINLATMLAGAVTNPFKNGYFQGPASAPLEAVSACIGMFGNGSYPGYPGRLLKDKTTGASYNANGANGRKFLLPAMWDPSTSTCKTLV